MVNRERCELQNVVGTPESAGGELHMLLDGRRTLNASVMSLTNLGCRDAKEFFSVPHAVTQHAGLSPSSPASSSIWTPVALSCQNMTSTALVTRASPLQNAEKIEKPTHVTIPYVE